MYYGSESWYFMMYGVMGFLYILNVCLPSSFVTAKSKKCMLSLLSYSAIKAIFLWTLLTWASSWLFTASYVSIVMQCFSVFFLLLDFFCPIGGLHMILVINIPGYLQNGLQCFWLESLQYYNVGFGWHLQALDYAWWRTLNYYFICNQLMLYKLSIIITDYWSSFTVYKLSVMLNSVLLGNYWL